VNAITYIEGNAIVTLTNSERIRFRTEAEAVAWAASAYGPRLLQVTLTAHTTDADTWAIRHWTERGGSGWRLWIDGQFVGEGELADLTSPGRAVA